MKFDVYCDEVRPDLFSSQAPTANFLAIGSLWLPTDKRAEFKAELHALRDKHRVGGEFKWGKVSPSRTAFYREIVDWFFAQNHDLRFRCIVVDRRQVDLMKYHESDQELGFYKFYYQLLHHWIGDFNDYAIYCDFKRNRLRDRLHVLQRCLGNSNLAANIERVQAVRSEESVLIQLVDTLSGACAARFNGGARGVKLEIIEAIERRIGHAIAPTYRGERKFNVFAIDLSGGW